MFLLISSLQPNRCVCISSSSAQSEVVCCLAFGMATRIKQFRQRNRRHGLTSFRVTYSRDNIIALTTPLHRRSETSLEPAAGARESRRVRAGQSVAGSVCAWRCRAQQDCDRAPRGRRKL